MEKPSPEQIQYQTEHYNESFAQEIHVSMSICLALATIAVFLRVVARHMSNATIRQDDHMIFVALVYRTPSPFCAQFSTFVPTLAADPVDSRSSSLQQATLLETSSVRSTISYILPCKIRTKRGGSYILLHFNLD